MAAKPKAVRPAEGAAEKPQLERFEEPVRELGAEYDEEAFACALVRVAQGEVQPLPRGEVNALRCKKRLIRRRRPALSSKRPGG